MKKFLFALILCFPLFFKLNSYADTITFSSYYGSYGLVYYTLTSDTTIGGYYVTPNSPKLPRAMSLSPITVTYNFNGSQFGEYTQIINTVKNNSETGRHSVYFWTGPVYYAGYPIYDMSSHPEFDRTVSQAWEYINAPPSQHVDIDGWDGFWILASYVWCSEWEYIGPDMKLNPKFDPYVYVITNPLRNSIDKLFGTPNTATNLSRIDVILDGSVIGSFNYDTESYTQQGGYFRIDKTKIGSDGYVDLEFKPYTREGYFGDSQICSINMKPSLDPYSNAYVQRYKSPNTGKEYQYLGTTNTKTTYHNPSTGVSSPVRKTSNPSVLVSTPIGEEPTGNELPPDSPSTPEPDPDDPTPPPSVPTPPSSEPDPTPGDPVPPSGTITPTPPPSGGLPKPIPDDPTPKPDINITINFDFGDLWGYWNKIKAKLDEGFSLFDNLVDDLRNYGIPDQVVIALGAVIATIILAAVLKLMIVIVKVIFEILPL